MAQVPWKIGEPRQASAKTARVSGLRRLCMDEIGEMDPNKQIPSSHAFWPGCLTVGGCGSWEHTWKVILAFFCREWTPMKLQRLYECCPSLPWPSLWCSWLGQWKCFLSTVYLLDQVSRLFLSGYVFHFLNPPLTRPLCYFTLPLKADTAGLWSCPLLPSPFLPLLSRLTAVAFVSWPLFPSPFLPLKVWQHWPWSCSLFPSPLLPLKANSTDLWIPSSSQRFAPLA